MKSLFLCEIGPKSLLITFALSWSCRVESLSRYYKVLVLTWLPGFNAGYVGALPAHPDQMKDLSTESDDFKLTVRNTFIDVVVDKEEGDEPLFRSSSDPLGGQGKKFKLEAASPKTRLATTHEVPAESLQEDELSTEESLCRTATQSSIAVQCRILTATSELDEAVQEPGTHAGTQAASSEEESPLFRTTANLPTPSPKLSEALGPADQVQTAPSQHVTMPSFVNAYMTSTAPAGNLAYMTSPVANMAVPVLPNMFGITAAAPFQHSAAFVPAGSYDDPAAEFKAAPAYNYKDARKGQGKGAKGKNKSNSRNFILAADGTLLPAPENDECIKGPVPVGAQDASAPVLESSRPANVAQAPSFGRLHKFHPETARMGKLVPDGRTFTKEQFMGRLSVITEDRVQTHGVIKYAVQFCSGDLSSADGVGFIFSNKLPCPKNIQKIVSIFANKTGRICVRAHAEVVRSEIGVKPLELGDWIELEMDLD
ncbi:Ppm1l, partial [Symbiodinium microadriaticum]